jgi:hypothetical protein
VKTLVEPPTMDPPTLTRVSEPTVFTQPPDIIPIPVVRPNLDITSWKLKPQDPCRLINPKKLVTQQVIRLGHRRDIWQFKSQVAIKITVPKALERGGQYRAEVALENMQRKCQALFKAVQRTDKKLYLLPFKYSDRPLNGDCTRVMRSEEMSLEYDEMLKYTPEFYVRTE